MPKLIISKNKEYSILVEVNLDDIKWRIYSPEYLPPFNVDELIRPCDVYRDGVYPGAHLLGDTTKQTSKIYRFPNYLEFSKIMEDEIVKIGEDRYLTTIFFNKRKDGWSNINIATKSGIHIGYCFNGILYNVKDKEAVNKVVYHTLYLSIISEKPDFKELTKLLSSGNGIELQSENEYFLDAFHEALKATLPITPDRSE